MVSFIAMFSQKEMAAQIPNHHAASTVGTTMTWSHQRPRKAVLNALVGPNVSPPFGACRLGERSWAAAISTVVLKAYMFHYHKMASFDYCQFLNRRYKWVSC